jgi:ketosteroid isomerase-like protein
VTSKDGGDTLVLNGNFLSILEKQDDGSWKIAIDCFNF